MDVPDLPQKVGNFLRGQFEVNNDPRLVDGEPIVVTSRPYVYHSATVIFYSPSDPSGSSGMRKEIIRACPNWRKRGPRYDCVFVETDDSLPGFRGLHVARVRCFFAFEYARKQYDCALVHWFVADEEEPDELTGMWTVEKDYLIGGAVRTSVIHIDSILRAAHLIPVYGSRPIDLYHDHRKSLDTFDRFYVNKYIDCHANEIAF